MNGNLIFCKILIRTFSFSPGVEKVEQEEEEVIEDVKQHDHTETLDVIGKENFMLSIGDKLTGLPVRNLQYCRIRSVDGTDLSPEKIQNRKVEEEKEDEKADPYTRYIGQEISISNIPTEQHDFSPTSQEEETKPTAFCANKTDRTENCLTATAREDGDEEEDHEHDEDPSGRLPRSQ